MIWRGFAIVVGPSGTGKTTLMKTMIEPLTRVLIMDAGFNEFDALSFNTLSELAAYLDQHGGRGGFFKVAYTPAPEEIPMLILIAKQLGEIEPITFVIEEADRMPDPKYEMPLYGDLIARGRHWGVNMILAAQRPADVAIKARGQATDLMAFYSFEPSDFKWLRDAVPALGEAVEQLPEKYVYAHFDKCTRKISIEETVPC